MDRDGIDKAIVFGGGPLGTGNLELYLDSFQAFNTWQSDFCKDSGGRMFACVPTHKSAEPGSLAVRMSLVERDLRLRSQPDVYYLKPHYEPHPIVLARLAKLSDKALVELLEVGWQFERQARKKPRR